MKQFLHKSLNSVARLVSAAKQQIPQLASKFCGLQQTVVPTHYITGSVLDFVPLQIKTHSRHNKHQSYEWMALHNGWWSRDNVAEW